LRVLSATLRKYDVGHLALYDGAFPYVVPVNHTYDEGRLIIHCALTGRKVDIIRRHPAACYGVYAPADGVISVDDAQGGIRSCQKNYESVICQGYARLAEDLEERRKLLGLFARDYRHAELKHAEEETCNCIVIDILEMTGRYAYHPAPKVIYHYAFRESGINAPYLQR
jgi:nitroimidazol reductase NimA-like FMN-containing flavoprotein (pyridoxamine 5'-phosphate oxidase superfamily)